MKNTKVLVFCLVVCALLIGCSGRDDAPQLVASYPFDNQIASSPLSPSEMYLVYHATITLEVGNYREAANRVTNLAYEYSGYLVSSQSWYQDGHPFGTVVLAVPAVYFDPVHQELLTIGNLITERVSGETVQPRPGNDGWRVYSQINVHLQQKDGNLFSTALPGWRPVRTLKNAWEIFVSIFGFLVDVLIWVVVIAGPFIFLGWVIKKILVYRKKTPSP